MLAEKDLGAENITYDKGCAEMIQCRVQREGRRLWWCTFHLKQDNELIKKMSYERLK